ncbi:alpha-hydroxy acid oxidase [Pseudogemmobacter sp. W21_MBD1_M6]|uniref:alpha-hydroxy acid oxidase n=1 Tax=Pseudogemmobacter sp. W21_MBD1_M6 TaxID=3240271 RepID=UPI003F9814A0
MPKTPSTIDAYRIAAHDRLDPAHRAYFDGGAGDELTLAANRRDFNRIAILPRVLRDVRGGGTAVRVLGSRLSCPVLVAPVAYQTLLSPRGECATAQAAAAQGVGMILSAQSATAMEDVQSAGEGNCAWFQLYWQAGRTSTLALADRARRAGFAALVLTVDAPVNGVRDREIAAGFRLPGDVAAVNLCDAAWPGFAPLRPDESMLFDRVAHILPNWDDVAWLCRNATLPVVLKGILSPADAALAVASGAAGIVVSNHGGRVLDGVPSAISVLPGVVAEVKGDVPVLMDSGIRRGADIFKALALGAVAVLVGRPVMWGLAAGGAQGASHVLRMLRDELEVTMVLAGCRTIADITPDCVYLNR